jgi:hypothetical protein
MGWQMRLALWLRETLENSDLRRGGRVRIFYPHRAGEKLNEAARLRALRGFNARHRLFLTPEQVTFRGLVPSKRGVRFLETEIKKSGTMNRREGSHG